MVTNSVAGKVLEEVDKCKKVWSFDITEETTSGLLKMGAVIANSFQ